MLTCGGIILATLLAAPSAVGADKQTQRRALIERLDHSRDVVRFFEGRGLWLRATRHDHCAQVPWQRSCRIARRLHKHHQVAARWVQRKLFLSLPHTNDWQTAVQVAQRVYPGTAGWLRSCSASEGGWGRWVPNNEGSGVGGWMQMYPSTFWRMWGAASDDMNRRGFTWPTTTESWYSPLGQALASAWGVTHGRRGEWHGAGC